LFDFNDLECYDPDGNYYGDGDINGNYTNVRMLADDLSYNSDSTNTSWESGRGNWAIEWQNSHTQNVDWYSCSAAHSRPLNGNLKAYAAWWLWARLAGWSPGASLYISSTTSLTQTNLDDATLTIELTNESFLDNSLSTSNFQLNNAPAGTTIESVQYTNDHQAILDLAFDGTDFDNDINNFSITIFAVELIGDENLTSNYLTIDAIDEGAPSVEINSSSALSETNLDDAVITLDLTNETFVDNSLAPSNFQLNNEPNGTTIESIQYVNEQQAIINLTYDATDFDDDITNFNITVMATELSGTENLTSNNLFIDAIDEEGPTANLSSDTELKENSLDGSVVKIVLSNATFNSNCNVCDNYELCNVPAGVGIKNIEQESDTEIDVILSFNGTDFDEDSINFCVRIDAGALEGRSDLLTNKLTIYADLESSISNFKDNNELKVYPNPLKEFVTLEFNSTSQNKLRLEIIDLAGKKLLSKEYDGRFFIHGATLDLRQLKKGNYYLVVDQGVKKTVTPLIKE
jgi:hypothetical protein